MLASCVYRTYTHGSAGKFGASAMPRRPRSQKLCVATFRFAKVVGVASFRLSNTLMIPLFSATKTRPSAAKRTAVGLVRPLKTTASWKPAGTVPASAGCAPANETPNASTPSAAVTRNRRRTPDVEEATCTA